MVKTQYTRSFLDKNKIRIRAIFNSISLVLISAINFYAQVSFEDSNLPIIVINTNTQVILDDPKITCEMGVIWNEAGSRNYLSDSFNNYSGKIGLEIRGSTSQRYPKKSYGFETRDSLGNNLNVNLLGLPKENDWILYGAYPDKSLMRNEITYSLFEKMHAWSPRYAYCELVIDNEYMGVYTLIEKIKRDDDRIDIDKINPNNIDGDALTGGYIIKIDKPTGSSSTPWVSDYQDELKYLYHDPKYEELNSTQRAYIENYVRDFEDAIYDTDFKDSILGYRPYINVESFIDFMLMQELGRTVDGYRSSSFMYKDRDSKGGRLTCGPMWDFNLSYGNADYCDGFLTTGWQYNFTDVCNYDNEPPNWWSRLLEDPFYADSLKCRWIDLRSTILSTAAINTWIDSTALILEESQIRNFTRWPILGEYVEWNYFIGDTYQDEVDNLKWWFEKRFEYLDLNLPGNCNMNNPTEGKANLCLYPNPTSESVYSNSTINADTELSVFSIQGQKVKFEVNNNRIDLSDLPSGIYLIKIFDQNMRVVKI